MKYKITLKGRTYEVEVERGEAMIVDEYEALAPVAPAAAPAPVAAAPAAPAANEPAPGTAGELILKNVSERDAAMVMAIVAHKMQKPLNELRFKSITEVK